MSDNEDQKPGHLCKACREARAAAHYQGTVAKYCARCKLLQGAAALAETAILSPGGQA